MNYTVCYRQLIGGNCMINIRLVCKENQYISVVVVGIMSNGVTNALTNVLRIKRCFKKSGYLFSLIMEA